MGTRVRTSRDGIRECSGVSLWDSLMLGRLAMGFANVRAGTRVPGSLPVRQDTRFKHSASESQKNKTYTESERCGRALHRQLSLCLESDSCHRAIIGTRILGRPTTPFSPFLIPNRAPRGLTPRC